MNKPENHRAVFAQIKQLNDLGTSIYYEVIYFNELLGQWNSYFGSNTFEDGEQVLKWKYADECFD